MRRAACELIVAGVSSTMLVLGCVSPSGGWDASALLASEPAVAGIEGQRLGDMTPYPALVDGQLLLVACRYSGDRAIVLRAHGAGLPREWVNLALVAVDQVMEPVKLSLLEMQPTPESASAASIDLVLVSPRDPNGPTGLGDTLSECDVSRTDAASTAVRGSMIGSEIRMRLAQPRMGRWLEWATGDEWIGALMHELGHALGFAGHVAAGSSLVVLEEGRLRSFGRRAIEGVRLRDPTLEALYRIPAGRLLGRATIDPAGQGVVDAVEALVRNWSASWGPGLGPIASVGDEQARIRWRWPTHEQTLELTFPHWRRELRAGRPITVVASAKMRVALGLSPGRAPSPSR